MQIKQQSTVQQAVNITGFSNPLYSPYYFSPDHDIFSPCQKPAFVSLLSQSTCSQLCLDRSCLSTTTTLTSNSFFLSIILCAHLTFLNNISFSVHMPFYISTPTPNTKVIVQIPTPYPCEILLLQDKIRC